jgi:flagellar motor component MotA
MRIENFWYEASPFLYTVVGGFFLGRSDSAIMWISSVILISAGGTITAMRRSYALKERATIQKKSSAAAGRPRRR